MFSLMTVYCTCATATLGYTDIRLGEWTVSDWPERNLIYHMLATIVFWIIYSDMTKGSESNTNVSHHLSVCTHSSTHSSSSTSPFFDPTRLFFAFDHRNLTGIPCKLDAIPLRYCSYSSSNRCCLQLYITVLVV